MDDHLYYSVKEYAECELIPRFEEEYRQHKKVSKCPSYEEMKDLCNVLTTIGKWAGFGKVKVTDYIPVES